MKRGFIVCYSLFFFSPLFLSQVPPPIECFDNQSIKTEDSTQVKITRLKCNSDAPDFSPVVRGKEFYFVSGRNNQTGVEYRDLSNDPEITDLYYTKLRDSLRSTTPVPLSGRINTKYYEGPFCFQTNGNQIYYTANEKNTTLLKIFTSENINEKWDKPQMLSFCQDSFSYCHPALSRNNDTMWFASNRKDGVGKMDIYFSRKLNGEWQKPINAGPSINSSYNEVFPFVTTNSYIYFSSDRPNGPGGLDLYRVDMTDSAIKTILLPHPLNSSGDDFGIWTDSTLEQGYFSSNRNKKYKDDIFYFARMLPDFTDAKFLPGKNKFCFTFYEERTQEFLDTVNFEFEWDFGDGQKARGVKTRHCYDKPGHYDIQLSMIQKVSGEVFKNQVSYEMMVDTPKFLSVKCRDTVVKGKCLPLTYYSEGLSNHKIKKAYWTFGDGKHNTGFQVNHIYEKEGEYLVTLYLEAIKEEDPKLLHYKAEKKITVLK
jgi:hypothetical protein